MKHKTYMAKRKKVSKKVYDKRMQQVALANKLKSVGGRFQSSNLKVNNLTGSMSSTEESNSENIEHPDSHSDSTQLHTGDNCISMDKKESSASIDVAVDSANVSANFPVEGRRLIHVRTLAKQMFCHKCQSRLYLEDITSEKQFGLASIFYIMCQQCHVNTGISTDEKHKAPNGRFHYNVNTEVVLGVLNGGMGNTHLNKVLISGKVPELNWKVFKRHENEVGKLVEQYSEESCMAAAKEERQLTIQNRYQMNKLL